MKAKRKKAWSLKLNLGTNGTEILGVRTSKFHCVCSTSSLTSTNVSFSFGPSFVSAELTRFTDSELVTRTANNRELEGVVIETELHVLEDLRRANEFWVGEKELERQIEAEKREMFRATEEETEEDFILGGIRSSSGYASLFTVVTR